MKKVLLGLSAIALFILVGCNNKSEKENEKTKINSDTTKMETSDDHSVKEIIPTYSNIDPALAGSLKQVFDHYLHIKNALVGDNGKDAANGGREMVEALTKIDKSLFTAEQKKVYDELADALKENAEHIGSSGDDIEHQRDHFSVLSENIYALVKAFGAGQILYHDHCPMYKEDKGGSLWLSEKEEISNPYMGSKMPRCGRVEEKIKG